MLRLLTAGESHGKAIVAVLEGMPAGLAISRAEIDHELRRRQGGYGRGKRMQIEQDQVEILSGVRHGETLGSPLTLVVYNRDHEKWAQVMSVDPIPGDVPRQLTRPRPGHADLAGGLKYDRHDLRDVLERASARSTVARVAAGAVCKRLLGEIGIRIGGHVVEIGDVAARPFPGSFDELVRAAEASDVGCADPEATERMKAAIDAARARGDTLGGIFEVVAHEVLPGLGSHVEWDRKLDGRLAQALCSIQAVKGVEIGPAFAVARGPGSRAHDEIEYARGRFARRSNRAGGLEGGMTNGEDVVLRAAMKPIATLMQPLHSVDVRTKEPSEAGIERSDVCAVPAARVIGEAAVAFVLAQAVLEKFGGDSLGELRRNVEGYRRQIEAY
jgi:chorismate synthase